MDIYKKLDYIFYVIFAIYNFLVKFFGVFNIKRRKLLKNNRKLKRDKDYCFILGNGPSLKSIDLTKINNEDTFAVNYFLDHCPDGFKSKYLVVIDTAFYKTDAKNYLIKVSDERKDVKVVSIDIDEEENYKLIQIANSGCSLKEEELPHLFDSFYRGSNAEKKDGSGLGLYIAKSLMKMMGGDVFAKIDNGEFKIVTVVKKC